MCGLLHSDHHGGSLDHGESLDTDVETEGLGGSGGDGGDDLFAGGGLKGHFGGNGALLDGNDFAFEAVASGDLHSILDPNRCFQRLGFDASICIFGIAKTLFSLLKSITSDAYPRQKRWKLYQRFLKKVRKKDHPEGEKSGGKKRSHDDVPDSLRGVALRNYVRSADPGGLGGGVA